MNEEETLIRFYKSGNQLKIPHPVCKILAQHGVLSRNGTVRTLCHNATRLPVILDGNLVAQRNDGIEKSRHVVTKVFSHILAEFVTTVIDEPVRSHNFFYILRTRIALEMAAMQLVSAAIELPAPQKQLVLNRCLSNADSA